MLQLSNKFFRNSPLIVVRSYEAFCGKKQKWVNFAQIDNFKLIDTCQRYDTSRAQCCKTFYWVNLLKFPFLQKRYCTCTSTLVKSGRGSSTAVERTPHNQEVVGSNPAGCWAFFFNFHIFLLSFTSVVIYQVPHGVATLTEHAESNKAASCKTGSIGSDWVKKTK